MSLIHDEPNLVRDDESKAVFIKMGPEYQAYLRGRDREKRMGQKIDSLENRNESLESRIAALEKLLGG